MIIRDKPIGAGHPCFAIAEIGVNHNGSVDTALQLVRVAAAAGCDAVKLQKRTPELQVPRDKWQTLRDTPFGEMATIDYRRRIELNRAAYEELIDEAHRLGLAFLASAWDAPSVAFLDGVGVDAHKVPSARLLDGELLRAVNRAAKPTIVSTGMADVDDIRRALRELTGCPVALLQCTSGYPVKDDNIDLPAIANLRELFDVPVGYSGHEVGLIPTLLAVAAYDACIIERHITLDRGMPGSDHGASLEPSGLIRLMRDIRRGEKLRAGSAVKRVHDCEREQAKRLGRVVSSCAT